MARRPGEWEAILEHAAAIVRSYDAGATLRQLFYRLVSDDMLDNTRAEYTQLSKRTAEARRDGWFPDLVDRTRRIHRHQTFHRPDDAWRWLVRTYRRDRTEGQEWAVYVGVEKDALVAQLWDWFGDLGVPILALRGYASQTYVDDIADDVVDDGRPSVLLYAGDFDPSGVDILRDAVERTGRWDRVERVALNPDQVVAYRLPPKMGKVTDTRAAGFVERFGQLVQVELDALPSDVLRQLYADAIGRFFDVSIHRDALDREAADRDALDTGWTT